MSFTQFVSVLLSYLLTPIPPTGSFQKRQLMSNKLRQTTHNQAKGRSPNSRHRSRQ